MNRPRTSANIWILCAAILGAGCVTKSTYLKEQQRANALQAGSAALAAQVQSLQTQIRDLQTKIDASTADNAALMKTLEAKKGELSQRLAELSKQNQELAQSLRETEQAKADEIAKLKGSYDQLVSGLQSELQAGQVTITQLQGRLSVNMVDKILFNSGEAEIKPAGFQVLDRVGEVLKKLQDKDIRIEGYTDNVPISAALRSRYPTNWELSTARATAVVRYLQDHGGIPSDRLMAVGYGDNRPLASNNTPDGRQQNRRIEIVLIPHEAAPGTAPAMSSSTATTAK